MHFMEIWMGLYIFKNEKNLQEFISVFFFTRIINFYGMFSRLLEILFLDLLHLSSGGHVINLLQPLRVWMDEFRFFTGFSKCF